MRLGGRFGPGQHVLAQAVVLVDQAHPLHADGGQLAEQPRDLVVVTRLHHVDARRLRHGACARDGSDHRHALLCQHPVLGDGLEIGRAHRSQQGHRRFGRDDLPQKAHAFIRLLRVVARHQPDRPATHAALGVDGVEIQLGAGMDGPAGDRLRPREWRDLADDDRLAWGSSTPVSARQQKDGHTGTAPARETAPALIPDAHETFPALPPISFW